MTDPVEPIRSTGIGSWPGTDMAEAIKITFAECPELPYLPELPARGAFAQMVGRGTALLSGLAVDLQPAGWRLTDASGRDHRSAKATLRFDLDQLEEAAQGYVGSFKFSFAGPWTLAATMERPRGDKVLGDPGARRDLAQSLAEGIAELIAEMRRRLPDLRPCVQLDEPGLPGVLSGSVPTASGLSRHRSLPEAEVREAFAHIVELLTSAETTAPVTVHCCAANPPIQLLHEAGVSGVLLDLDQLRSADWDALGSAMEKGLWMGAGALPTGSQLSADEVSRRILRPLRGLGLDPAVAAQTVVTPACGLFSALPADAVKALRTLRTAAGIVTEQLAD